MSHFPSDAFWSSVASFARPCPECCGSGEGASPRARCLACSGSGEVVTADDEQDIDGEAP